MHTKLVALVTGANKGIGLQIAKDLTTRGLTVLIGSRDLSRGEAAAREVGADARAIQLDVTDGASIAAAASRIERELGRLDVLINNAGVASLGDDVGSFEERIERRLPSRVSIDEVRGVFETNVFGVIAVTQAMLPLLREAPDGRIVNVSSEVGSLAKQTDPSNPYRHIISASYSPSKTALNAVTVAFANELAGTRIKVNAMCPGFTATDLNQHRGTRSVAQGAREAVRLALLGEDGPTASFSNEAGPLPW
ncbi:MAG: SDR family NAD(P)-dependent oxidoreductase [Deltaproteobacteria bacterium]|nr:SDR family NAD(P)-dependent oxidoreductase [Deltaproteobacteria bacterium]